MGLSRADYLMLETYGYACEGAYWGSLPSTFLISLPTAAHTESANPAALDLACGQGRNAAVLAARGFDVTAIDSSPLAIKTVNTLRMPKVTARTGDLFLEAENLVAESFDVILCNHGLQYLADLDAVEAFIGHCLRALRPGGFLALSYFTEPRSVHPLDVQEGALLLPREWLLQHFQGIPATRLCYFQFEHMVDDHGGSPHAHAVERLIVSVAGSTDVN